MRSTLARALLLAFGLALAGVALLAFERSLRAQEQKHGLILDGAPPRLKHEAPPLKGGRDLPAGGDPRVLILGDSVTAGFMVGANRAWPRLAEGQLRRRGQRAVLINHAASGYDIEQIAASLQETGWSKQPERLVYAAFTNDHVETVVAYLHGADAPTWLGTTAQPGVLPLPASLLNPLLQRSALARRAMGAAATRRGRDPFAAQLGGNLDFFRVWARWLAEQAEARDIPLMVFLVPAHILADPEGRPCQKDARMALECREHAARLVDYEAVFTELGVPVVSALPALRASGKEAFWIEPMRDDPAHPNALGHAVLAEAFVEAFTAWEAGALNAP